MGLMQNPSGQGSNLEPATPQPFPGRLRKNKSCQHSASFTQELESLSFLGLRGQSTIKSHRKAEQLVGSKVVIGTKSS